MECIVFIKLDDDRAEKGLIVWDGYPLISFPYTDKNHYLTKLKSRASRVVGKGNWVMRKANLELTGYAGS